MSTTAPAATCACGYEYADTAEGRWRHRVLFSHTPCPPRGDTPA